MMSATMRRCKGTVGSGNAGHVQPSSGLPGTSANCAGRSAQSPEKPRHGSAGDGPQPSAARASAQQAVLRCWYIQMFIVSLRRRRRARQAEGAKPMQSVVRGTHMRLIAVNRSTQRCQRVTRPVAASRKLIHQNLDFFCLNRLAIGMYRYAHGNKILQKFIVK